MGTYLKLSDIILNRIKTMHEQGYSLRLIAKECGVTDGVVRNRLGMDKHGIAIGRKVGGLSKQEVVVPPATCKYDYILNEPICQGKFYSEYVK